MPIKCVIKNETQNWKQSKNDGILGKIISDSWFYLMSKIYYYKLRLESRINKSKCLLDDSSPCNKSSLYSDF